MRKVLLMIHRLLQGGGTETHVRLLAKKLVQEGYQVGVFTSGGPWTPSLQKAGIRIHMADGDIGERLRLLRQIVVRERYTLLHAHDGSSCRLAAAVKGPQRAVVMTIHGTYMFDGETQQAARKADAVIAVSEDIAAAVQHAGIRRERLHLIYNGISTHTFHPARTGRLRRTQHIPGDAFVIGYAGRFTYAKEELGRKIVRALYPYVAANPGVYMLVAGRNSLETLRTRHGRIRICGHVDDMGSFYRSCNVVIGTGRVALEAAATGTPTVAVGEMKWVGRLHAANLDAAARSNFGDHGHRYKAWHRGQLLQAIKDIASDSRQAETDALRLSRHIARHYSAGQMCRQVIRVYHQVDTRKRSGRSVRTKTQV
ncbi:MAG: glycosyltransferase family 4 protein [Firmicutes bacterium]|nr:glycosyltransferase family 4 protein [Bacillota bacterium]